jgi:hypothetical protein
MNTNEQALPIAQKLVMHASKLYQFLIDNFLPFDVCDVISIQKVLEKLDKMTTANLCRQQQTTLSPYIFSNHHQGIFHLSSVLLFVFQFILLLVLIEHVSMIILFIKCIPFNNVTFNDKFFILLNVTFQLYKTKKESQMRHNK